MSFLSVTDLTVLEHFELLFKHGVAVLLEEAVHLILDLLGKVVDYERLVGHARLAEVALWRVGARLSSGGLQILVVELVAPGHVGAFGHFAFFVEQIEDAYFTLDQLDARLIVVKLDERPFDLLSQVLFLLKFEYMLFLRVKIENLIFDNEFLS